MAQPKKTLYQILGVPRDATEEQIALAFEMKSAEMQQRVPPDPGGVALVSQAHEVLSNPPRRAAYDASLAAAAERAAAQQALAQGPDLEVDDAAALAQEDRRRKIRLASMVGGMAIVFLILFLAIRPKAPAPAPAPEPVAEAKPAPPPAPRARSAGEILADAAASGGQVLSYSMAGTGTPVGMALSIEPGHMITTCHGLPAGAKLVVKLGAQLHAADLTITDEQLDLCRLAVAGLTAPPVRVASGEAKPGDKVFVFGMDAKGAPQVMEAKVNQVRNTPRGPVMEISQAIAPTGSGSGVFDEFGQVVGITTAPHDYGAGIHVAVPVSWTTQMRSRATATK